MMAVHVANEDNILSDCQGYAEFDVRAASARPQHKDILSIEHALRFELCDFADPLQTAAIDRAVICPVVSALVAFGVE